MQYLKTIRLRNWKSIQDQTIELRHLNVMIGSNGAGKSNLISLFKMLNEMFAHQPGFRNYVGKSGGADSLLYLGKRNSPTAEMELTFQADTGLTRYFASWAAASGDSLIFTDEKVQFLPEDSTQWRTTELGAGHAESKLAEFSDAGIVPANVALNLMRKCRLYHFHDTSDNASLRHPSNLSHDRYLFPDANNLATILYLFESQHPVSFKRISSAVKQLIPSFHSFLLEPSRLNKSKIEIKWFQQGSTYELGPHQLSDGSIRFVALAALLSQPKEMLPLLIALDEPELGLHPAALEKLAGIAKAASLNCQLFMATQSPVFLDYFEPENVLVANSEDGRTNFSRLSTNELGCWREEYSLGEIWEKNVIGGGPY